MSAGLGDSLGGGGGGTFTSLTDTPGSINALQYLRGNAGGTALEFITATALAATLSHGNLSGLGADDHPQYLLDGVGRASVQSLIGGLAAGDVLSVQGANSGGADVGRIDFESPVELNYAEGNTTPAEQVAMRWRPTFTTAGAYIGGLIANNAQITYTNAFYIYSSLADSSLHTSNAVSGFQAFTLFNPLCVIQNGTSNDSVQMIVYNDGGRHNRVTAGTSTTPQHITVSSVPVIAAQVNGATMTWTTGAKGMQFTPRHNTVAGSTINGGTLCSVQQFEPTVPLFGTQNGTENYSNIFGMDFLAHTTAVSGVIAVLNSAMTNATNRFFLRNVGGATSIFGAGTAHWNDNAGTAYGNTELVPDVLANWSSATSAFELDFAAGEDFRIGAGTNFHTFAPSGTLPELRMGYGGYHFGSTGSLGNQFINTAMPAQSTRVAGEWATVNLSYAGNLTLAHAMTALYSWNINPLSITTGAGSINGPVVTLNASQTNSGIGTNDRAAFRSNGRFWLRGALQHEPIRGAQVVANQAAYNAWGSGAGEREWLLVDSDATRQIQGIVAPPQNADGATRTFTNDGANNFEFTHQDGAAVAANRIITETGATVTVGPEESRELRYDGALLRWRLRAA